MAPVLDGNPQHMHAYPEHQRFVEANVAPVNVCKALKESGAEILINYLPVGSQKATEHVAQACLDAEVAFVNCIPVFIASDRIWAARFAGRPFSLPAFIPPRWAGRESCGSGRCGT